MVAPANPLRGSTLAAALVALLTSPPESAGQERPRAETIASDRPGLGDGAHVLASGVWQVELGLGVDGADGRRLYSIGQGVLRLGLSPFELRLYPNSVVVRRSDGSSDSGLQDVGVGVKLGLGPGDAGRRMSLVVGVTLPTGSQLFSADRSTGFSTLVLEGGLSESVGVALNVGYAFPFDDAGDGTVAVILTPGLALPNAVGLSAYAGYAGFFGVAGRSPTHILEAGIAYLVNADVQLDANAGWDPDRDAWFFGVGVAVRRR